jgi:hypothetical protein
MLHAGGGRGKPRAADPNRPASLGTPISPAPGPSARDEPGREMGSLMYVRADYWARLRIHWQSRQEWVGWMHSAARRGIARTERIRFIRSSKEEGLLFSFFVCFLPGSWSCTDQKASMPSASLKVPMSLQWRIKIPLAVSSSLHARCCHTLCRRRVITTLCRRRQQSSHRHRHNEGGCGGGTYRRRRHCCCCCSAAATAVAVAVAAATGRTFEEFSLSKSFTACADGVRTGYSLENGGRCLAVCLLGTAELVLFGSA